MNPDFVSIGKLADIPDPGKQLFAVDDRLVVVFRVENEVFCLEDVCTHDSGPLGEGALDGYTIACPRHGARFDIRTGEALTMPATEDTIVHEAKVENGEILIRITP